MALDKGTGRKPPPRVPLPVSLAGGPLKPAPRPKVNLASPDTRETQRTVAKANVRRGAPASGGIGTKEVGKLTSAAKAAAKMPTGDHIAALQQTLRDQGYDIAVDGVWGPKSAKAWAESVGAIRKHERQQLKRRVDTVLRNPEKADPREKLALFGFQGASALDRAWLASSWARTNQAGPQTATGFRPTVDIMIPLPRGGEVTKTFKTADLLEKGRMTDREATDYGINLALERSGVTDTFKTAAHDSKATRVLGAAGDWFVVGPDLSNAIRGEQSSRLGVALDLAMLPVFFAKGPVAGARALQLGLAASKLTPEVAERALAPAEKRLLKMARANAAAGRELTHTQEAILARVEDPLARFRYAAGVGYRDPFIQRAIKGAWNNRKAAAAIKGLTGKAVEADTVDPLLGAVRVQGELVSHGKESAVIRTADGNEVEVPYASTLHMGEQGSATHGFPLPTREEAAAARQAHLERAGGTGDLDHLSYGVVTKGVDMSVLRGEPDVKARLANMREYLKRGEGSRFWYEDSAREILAFTGGDKVMASRLAQVIAVMSAQREPRENINLAVEAYRQWKAGKKITVGTGSQRAKALMILEGGNWEGRKTDRFFKNMLEDIDPEAYARDFPTTGREVTVDIWVARTFGLKTDHPTPREYEQISKAIENIADFLGWKPKQVQAAMWGPIRRDTDAARKAARGSLVEPVRDDVSENFATELEKESARIPFEVAPGVRTAEEVATAYWALNPEARLALDNEVVGAVQDFLREVGVLGKIGAEGAGEWEGKTNRAWTVLFPAAGTGHSSRLVLKPQSKQQLTAITAIIADALKQDAAAWYRPYFRKSNTAKSLTGVNVQGWSPTGQQILDLEGEFARRGYAVALPPDVEGFSILVFNKEGSKALQAEVEAVLRSVMDEGDAEADVTLRWFAHQNALVKRGRNGTYVHAHRGFGGRPDVRGAADRLAQTVSSLHTQHLGDVGGAERAGADIRAAGDEALDARAAGPVATITPWDVAVEREADAEAQAWVDRLKQAVLDETGAVEPGAFVPALSRGLDEPYPERLLQVGGLEVQGFKPRSRLAQLGMGAVDRFTRMIDTESMRERQGVRIMTMSERAVKQAGRMQRVEMNRRQADFWPALHEIAKVKEGSVDDIAHFWYAQLPEAYRNVEGLQLVKEAQQEELAYIASGMAARDLAEREQAVRIAQKEAETKGEVMRLQNEIEDIKTTRSDLKNRAGDIAASMKFLDDVIAADPPVNNDLLNAIGRLAENRRQILVDAGRLDPERAEGRTGLVANWLGLEPDGTEIYMGHRLPKPPPNLVPMMPSGGTGRVASPRGMSENRLVLARTGRLRPSTRVAAEDWQAAQVFAQANIAREQLAAMGVPFKFQPHDSKYVLVNPKGRTIPAYWRTDELAQFKELVDDIEDLRTKAEEILEGFVGEGAGGWQRIQDDFEELSRTRGVEADWSELRLVPKRFVERYYAQFRAASGRSTPGALYDMMVDAMSASIIFARIGYIPKNVVQNLIMALPHQGAFFPMNAAKAAQLLADPELRHLAKAEVGFSSASEALSREVTATRLPGEVLHKTAGFVGTIADDPARMSAFLHEAAAENVISRFNPILTEKDRANLRRLFMDPRQRARLNDISRRATEAMADFTRLTPGQSKIARRLLIIPGWLVAGSRYPFHFALTHPIRSALIAYALLGEPGAPDELRFNEPVSHYFKGKRWLRGIDTPWGRERTGSLNPVSTPWELSLAIGGSIKGKDNPYDRKDTVFDYANPIGSTLLRASMGDLGGAASTAERLVPNYALARDLINPPEEGDTGSYPGDVTRLGRLRREVGILPIPVEDEPPKKRRSSSAKGRPSSGRPGSSRPGSSRPGSSRPGGSHP